MSTVRAHQCPSFVKLHAPNSGGRLFPLKLPWRTLREDMDVLQGALSKKKSNLREMSTPNLVNSTATVRQSKSNKGMLSFRRLCQASFLAWSRHTIIEARGHARPGRDHLSRDLWLTNLVLRKVAQKQYKAIVRNCLNLWHAAAECKKLCRESAAAKEVAVQFRVLHASVTGWRAAARRARRAAATQRILSKAKSDMSSWEQPRGGRTADRWTVQVFWQWRAITSSRCSLKSRESRDFRSMINYTRCTQKCMIAWFCFAHGANDAKEVYRIAIQDLWAADVCYQNCRVLCAWQLVCATARSNVAHCERLQTESLLQERQAWVTMHTVLVAWRALLWKERALQKLNYAHILQFACCCLRLWREVALQAVEQLNWVAPSRVTNDACSSPPLDTCTSRASLDGTSRVYRAVLLDVNGSFRSHA